MTILYSVVARGTTILARFASCTGNFAEVAEQILRSIAPENAKLTYTHSSYLFHYISEDGIVYLCITTDDFQRSTAFMYLEDVKGRFQKQYASRVHTALPFAMDTEFSRVLSTRMRYYSESRKADHMTKVQDQLDELKGIMVKNIDLVANRGEKLELLVDKTEDLSHSAMTFKKSSRGLARAMWWKNAKITILLVVIILLVIFFIVVAACGGFSFKKCK
ncbi:vesicle-associated membrane protein 7-like [Oscarella lobularis]|uniref:vesicle-associated membrane protein 7-like n=1 Tax=Oscarella lobularis TaxID=121494 RepID=UPI00331382B3